MHKTRIEQMKSVQGYEKSGDNIEHIRHLSQESRNLSNNLEKTAVKKFLLKLTVFQVLLLIVIILGYVFYQYLDWENSSNKECHNIAEFLTASFDSDTELIEVIKSKLLKHTNYDKLLDVATYNKILSLEKSHINISTLYLIKVDNKSNTIFTKYGKESFAILPSESFFNVLRIQNYPGFYAQNEDIFIGKAIKKMANSVNEFVILKIDLASILQKIQSQLKVKGSISILNVDDRDVKNFQAKNLLNLGSSNLVLNYTPWSFWQHITSQNRFIRVFSTTT